MPASGGERLLRNGCHQRVSELWRAAGVPPWRRAQWPLVYEGDTLRCVPGVGWTTCGGSRCWRPGACGSTPIATEVAPTGGTAPVVAIRRPGQHTTPPPLTSAHLLHLKTIIPVPWPGPFCYYFFPS
ncbi:tRNA lysidine(34) synthetase TilS [Alcanivorax sp. IO_7]|nr:tRNA lysidine(34) synthetase TilS [Alcanivorax sp. IO_7]